MNEPGKIKKPLLVMKFPTALSEKTQAILKQALSGVAEHIGAEVVIADRGADCSLHQDHSEQLAELISLQREQLAATQAIIDIQAQLLAVHLDDEEDPNGAQTLDEFPAPPNAMSIPVSIGTLD